MGPLRTWTLSGPEHIRQIWLRQRKSVGSLTSPAFVLKAVAINAFADFALAVFPFSFIKDLRLQLHRKVTLGLLMCCGIV